jgi:hypothetical protein
MFAIGKNGKNRGMRQSRRRLQNSAIRIFYATILNLKDFLRIFVRVCVGQVLCNGTAPNSARSERKQRSADGTCDTGKLDPLFNAPNFHNIFRQGPGLSHRRVPISIKAATELRRIPLFARHRVFGRPTRARAGISAVIRLFPDPSATEIVGAPALHPL